MATTTSYPLARERAFILGSLILLAAVAWGLLLWQARSVDNEMAMDGRMEAGLTQGMVAPLFLAMWVAMMFAMMFPAAAPMILTFARIAAGKQQRQQPFVP